MSIKRKKSEGHDHEARFKEAAVQKVNQGHTN